LESVGQAVNKCLISLATTGVADSSFGTLPFNMQRILSAYTRREGDRVILDAPQYEMFFTVRLVTCITRLGLMLSQQRCCR
jgi:hypothetical protein